MSLISDALKKAELHRAQPSLSRVSGWDQHQQQAHFPLGPQSSAPASSSRGLLFANVVLLGLLCVTAFYFWRNRPSGERDPSPSVALDRADAVDIAATRSPPASDSADQTIEDPRAAPTIATSPFLQPAGEKQTEPAETAEYDLGGTSTLGSNTLLSVVRRSDRRSIWIPVGKTVGEVTALSYNPETDEAVIRVRGESLTISMRQFTDGDSDPDTEAEPAE